MQALQQVWDQLGLRTVQDLLDAPRDGSDVLADLFRRSQFEEDTSPLWSDAMLALPSEMITGSSSAAFHCGCSKVDMPSPSTLVA